MIFLFFGLTSIRIITSIFDKAFKNNEDLTEKNQSQLRIATIVMVVISLGTISVLQREYILLNETPPVHQCYYYDQHGNYVHGSRLLYNCPTPTIVEKTDDRLEMTFLYTFYSMNEGYSGSSSNMGGPEYQYRRVEEGAMLVSVELRYRADTIIDFYRYREVTNFKADDYSRDESIDDFDDQFALETETYYTNYFEVVIDTDYSDGLITQTKNVYLDTYNEGVVTDVEDLDFKQFERDNIRWQNIYRVPYRYHSDKQLDFEIYADRPLKDETGETPLYEGSVTRISPNSIHLDYTSESVNGLNMYSIQEYESSGKMDNDSFTNNTNRDMDFLLLEDFGIYYLESLQITHTDDEGQDKNETYSLNDFGDYYLYNDGHSNNLFLQTDYGFKIESYLGDGVRDESELHNFIGEISGLGNGPDDTILDHYNFPRLTYKYSIFYDNNPLIDYLILQMK